VSGRRIIFPREAVIRRPGLIKALGAQYGGARDAQLPDGDCEATLPELPSLTRLAQRARSAQPFCQGTIRFSVWKDHAQLVAAARLHRPEIWQLPKTARVWPREEIENVLAAPQFKYFSIY
jgi:hypothetical protein